MVKTVEEVYGVGAMRGFDPVKAAEAREQWMRPVGRGCGMWRMLILRSARCWIVMGLTSMTGLPQVW